MRSLHWGLMRYYVRITQKTRQFWAGWAQKLGIRHSMQVAGERINSLCFLVRKRKRHCVSRFPLLCILGIPLLLPVGLIFSIEEKKRATLLCLHAEALMRLCFDCQPVTQAPLYCSSYPSPWESLSTLGTPLLSLESGQGCSPGFPPCRPRPPRPVGCKVTVCRVEASLAPSPSFLSFPLSGVY